MKNFSFLSALAVIVCGSAMGQQPLEVTRACMSNEDARM